MKNKSSFIPKVRCLPPLLRIALFAWLWSAFFTTNLLGNPREHQPDICWVRIWGEESNISCVDLPVGGSMVFYSPASGYGCVRFDSVSKDKQASYSFWECRLDGSIIRCESKTRKTVKLILSSEMEESSVNEKGLAYGVSPTQEISFDKFVLEWRPPSTILVPQSMSIAFIRGKEKEDFFWMNDLSLWYQTPLRRPRGFCLSKNWHYNRGQRFWQGVSFLDKKDYDRAFRTFAPLARDLNWDAQAVLGDFYANGFGVKRDLGKAKEYYEKAAFMKQPGACFILGLIYESEARDDEQSLKKAFEYYLDSTDEGNSYGYLACGLMFENGKGVREDLKEAVSCYWTAARKGNIDAEIFLGQMFERGLGVEKSFEQATVCYTIASQNGRLNGLNSLANLYVNQGTKLDYAEKLIRYAIEKDCDNPLYLDTLGWVLYKQKKYDLALKQLEKVASVKADSERPYRLASSYKKLGYHFASENYRAGQMQEAEKRWEKAVEVIEDAKLKSRLVKALKKLETHKPKD